MGFDAVDGNNDGVIDRNEWRQRDKRRFINPSQFLSEHHDKQREERILRGLMPENLHSFNTTPNAVYSPSVGDGSWDDSSPEMPIMNASGQKDLRAAFDVAARHGFDSAAAARCEQGLRSPAIFSSSPSQEATPESQTSLNPQPQPQS